MSVNALFGYSGSSYLNYNACASLDIYCIIIIIRPVLSVGVLPLRIVSFAPLPASS
jgi:hypothetical protein